MSRLFGCADADVMPVSGVLRFGGGAEIDKGMVTSDCATAHEANLLGFGRRLHAVIVNLPSRRGKR